MDGYGWNNLGVRAGDEQVGEVSALAALDASDEFQFRSNTTSELINGLQFQAAKSVRTSVITTASFNVVAAVATLACVLWDCWVKAKRDNPSLTWRTIRPNIIGPAAVYPLVLSCGIIGQGIMFAFIQSKGLQSLMILDCMSLSQLTMPAIFTTPYIQIVLGFETAIRALLRRPFPPRWRFTILICLAIIFFGLLGTYLVTLSIRPPNFCYATLFWLIRQWNIVVFALLTSITGAVLLIAGLIFFRLLKTTGTLPEERESASQMVWYLLASVVTNTLMLPFFYVITFKAQDENASTELSMIASVASNLSGIITGGLYLFFRSNQKSVIQPKDTASVENEAFEKHLQRWGSRTSLISAPPILPEKSEKHQAPPSPSIYSDHSYDDDAHPYDDARDSGVAPSSVAPTPIITKTESFPRLEDVPSIPSVPSPSMMPSPLRPSSSRPITRRESYSLFPTKRPSFLSPGGLLPATTYAPSTTAATPERTASPVTPGAWEMLMPPPMITGEGHHRNSSLSSSGTVQIGLRISNMNDVQPFKVGQLDTPRQSRKLKSGLGVDKADADTRAADERKEQNSSYMNLPKPPERSLQASETPAPEEPLTSPSAAGSSPRRKQWTRSKAASPNGVGMKFALAGKPQIVRIPGFQPQDEVKRKPEWI